MKRDLFIVIVSGVITVSTILLALFVDVRFAMITLLSFVILFGYSLGFIKEKTRAKYDGDEYQQIRFPARFLYYGNTALLVMAITLFIIDITMADASFKGLMSLIIGVFVVPEVVGMYIVIYCINILSKRKQGSS